ncbi:uroporphyrinogen decarboxylase family protein [Sporomusa sp. KB1]|jgi:uroporphyrinogen decarboxylase|uniref:uroporphyrinogen decarboxylase family protein n=1 Tax=Sporomusa sp. KB1 TaxID=943346 RepID=UPI00119FCDF6|nr:uroporphyrinogen decarboxylase family protein [Sporomusa sp. KB1]TWH47208.1 uroporphyrinogen decarboxylase [Sporomusa sp. KB1]
MSVSVKPDTMTPKERVLGCLQGTKIDRLPSAPLVLNHCSRVTGVTVSQFNSDAKVMGEAQVAAWKRYGYDIPLMFTTTSTVAEAMGTELFFPVDDAPWVEHPVVEDTKNIDKVKVADPWQDGRLPVYLNAARHVVNEIGEQVFVGCIFAAPFTTASHLRGTEMFIRETYKNPGLVNELLDLSKASALAMIDALAEIGVVPVIVDPVASASLISPRQFEKFAMPRINDIIAHTHAKGLPICLHICGKTTPIIELMGETGADILSIDIIDMELTKKLVGSKACLLGNVKPAETMLKGTPEKIMAEVQEIIRSAGDSPRGLIVSTGCETPFNTPPANIDAVMTATRLYGQC